MLLSLINNPVALILYLTTFIMSLVIHEVSHGFVADRLGDPTARLMGRLTLNPLAHLDPLGTLMILFAPFGWAKPVPFDPFNLRNPRKDSALISLAGPAANLLLALVSASLLHIIPGLWSLPLIGIFLELLVRINISLMMFNLIPIHPLDGFHIVEGFLPENAARQWHTLQSLGLPMMFILVIPIFGSSPVLSFIQPAIATIVSFLLP
jgi:Zn-dependent protease